jgi:hypothetical protein
VYGSKDIALKISQDEILGFLCAGTFPTWQDIRDFTHHNHDLIEQSLIRTCQLARELGPRTRVAFPADCQRGKLEGVNDRTQPDRELQFATTAQRWIQQAEDSEAIYWTTDAPAEYR